MVGSTSFPLQLHKYIFPISIKMIKQGAFGSEKADPNFL